jgi:hypothetical protein
VRERHSAAHPEGNAGRVAGPLWVRPTADAGGSDREPEARTAKLQTGGRTPTANADGCESARTARDERPNCGENTSIEGFSRSLLASMVARMWEVMYPLAALVLVTVAIIAVKRTDRWWP